jgi:hypothetical protein
MALLMCVPSLRYFGKEASNCGLKGLALSELVLFSRVDYKCKTDKVNFYLGGKITHLKNTLTASDIRQTYHCCQEDLLDVLHKVGNQLSWKMWRNVCQHVIS